MSDATAEPEPLWAVVELMGHVRLAGRLTEEEKFGARLGRLEIPQGDGWVTRWFGGSSVYSITAVSEAAARLVAAAGTVAPVHSWELPKTLPAPVPGRVLPCGHTPEDCDCDPPDDGDDEGEGVWH